MTGAGPEPPATVTPRQAERRSRSYGAIPLADVEFTVGDAPPVTPGQAAYEAWRHAVTPADKPLINPLEAWWGGLDDDGRAAWDAAAQAAIAASSGTLPRLHELLAARRERDEARKGLADIQHGAGARVRDAVASATGGLTAELATCRERNAAIAVQLDQYRDERDGLRTLVAEILGEFERVLTHTEATNLVGGTDVATWRQRAGLGEP